MQNSVATIIRFKDLFDEEPESYDFYLNGIPQDILIEYAIRFCSLSTLIEPDVRNIFLPFFLNGDEETEFYSRVKEKINKIVKHKFKNPFVLNTRSSLKFFELVQNIQNENNGYSEFEIRERLFKVYLLINENIIFKIDTNNHIELIIVNSLLHLMYNETNYLYLRIAELIKSANFLIYCKENLKVHYDKFLIYYGINKWQEYTMFLNQIGMLILPRNLENPLFSITIPKDSAIYEKKVFFFDRFVLEMYDRDADFSLIKSRPVIKNLETGEYRIVFEQFFIEKMYKSLYFKFKEINGELKGNHGYIEPGKFRSDIGKYFSEKVILNNIFKDALGKKYKHLGFKELTREGCPDYYIRDGKYIYLIECKDNFIKKELLENFNIRDFISKLRLLFLSNEQGKPKAIKQIINNILDINENNFIEDSYIPQNKIIYPLIITHNSIFSLPGINALVNDWFNEELKNKIEDRTNIKNVTIIDINTIILYQEIISQNKYCLRNLIEMYWKSNNNLKNIHKTDDFIFKFQSFSKFVEVSFAGTNIFNHKLSKYDQYFVDSK